MKNKMCSLFWECASSDPDLRALGGPWQGEGGSSGPVAVSVLDPFLLADHLGVQVGTRMCTR